MKMFDSVVIACVKDTLDIAMAIRSSLELFRLNVYLHFCVQKKNVIDFLAGDIPDSEYVILCCGGHHTGEPGPIAPGYDRISINFIDVVDFIDGKWDALNFSLTPENIGDYVNLPDRTVICCGCNTGWSELAEAFLAAGCKAYIAPSLSVDQDSTALFPIGFFYHLLRGERDASLSCSDKEAVELAAAFDERCKEGTHVFRYYDKQSS